MLLLHQDVYYQVDIKWILHQDVLTCLDIKLKVAFLGQLNNNQKLCTRIGAVVENYQLDVRNVRIRC